MIELGKDYASDPVLLKRHNECVQHFTEREVYVDTKRSTCPTHEKETVYTGILGLWICPACAYKNRTGGKVHTKAHTPYKEDKEEVYEVQDLSEINALLPF